MANIKQQKKRVRIAERQRGENLRYRSTIKTYFRRLQAAVDGGDTDVVTNEHRELQTLVDRAAAKRALHPRNAARKKARAARLVAAGPRVETRKRTRRAPAKKTAAKK